MERQRQHEQAMERWRQEAHAHEKEMFGMFIKVMGECNAALTSRMRPKSATASTRLRFAGGGLARGRNVPMPAPPPLMRARYNPKVKTERNGNVDFVEDNGDCPENEVIDDDELEAEQEEEEEECEIDVEDGARSAAKKEQD